MTMEFYVSLSQDFNQLLDGSDDYDVTIRVGETDKEKTFHAHSVILRARSPYFRTALANNWARKEGNFTVFSKPNISPVVFDLILKYMYSGTVNLSRQNNFDVLDLLIASDELLLSELFDHTQNYLLHTKFEWVKRNAVKVHRTVYPHEGCKKLQDFCLDTICKNPMLVFGSKDFLEFEEALLLPLLSRNDLQTDEIDIWDHLIHWGLAQMSGLNFSISTFSSSSSSSSTLSSFVSIDSSTFSDDNNSLSIDNNVMAANNVDLSNWSNEDFLEFERILHNFIPLVRFFHISSGDFYDKVWPFQKILPDDLREDILQYHLKRNTTFSNSSYYAITHSKSSSQPANSSTLSLPPPRNISRYFQPPRTIPFDSTLLRTEHIARLCDWIDRKDGKPYSFDEIPYKFKLLVRGSRDGFEAETFHEKCDKLGATITVMQIACSGELIGGYNPIEWTTGDCRITTQNSFLFSFPKASVINNSNNQNGGIGMYDVKSSGSNLGYSNDYNSGNENRVNGPNSDNGGSGQSNERRSNLVDAKLSRVRRPGYAIRIKDKTYGPCFGDKDLWMKNNFNAYDSCSSDKDDYSERVTTLSKFWVMEYEVFQVVRK